MIPLIPFFFHLNIIQNLENETAFKRLLDYKFLLYLTYLSLCTNKANFQILLPLAKVNLNNVNYIEETFWLQVFFPFSPKSSYVLSRKNLYVTKFLTHSLRRLRASFEFRRRQEHYGKL